MPSHRQGNIPKHRAGRPHENARRRRPFSAANPAKRIAPGGSRDSYGSGPEPAAPAPSARPAASSRRARGLLVTPWFAAGAGFVIAAALSLNSPRTFLTYRPSTTPGTSCADCQPAAVPTARPGVQIRSANPARVGGGRRAAAAPAVGPAVPFHLGAEHNGVFSVTFMLPAGQVARPWKLRFELPGRSITEVVGAGWRPNAGEDGGVAAALGQGQGQYVSPVDPAGVSFLVSAAGPPVRPTGCLLDGRACHFG
jgi:hypothetical protein